MANDDIVNDDAIGDTNDEDVVGRAEETEEDDDFEEVDDLDAAEEAGEK